MTQYIGKQFGDYHLIRYLGGGGFADVYLGNHIYLPSEAAVKVLRGQLSTSELLDLRNEAHVILRLLEQYPPHIIQLKTFSIAEIEGQQIPFLAMDYAPNGTLRELHPRGQQVPLSTIVSYVKQIAEALEYIHSQKVIHRDIKPSNLLVGKDGRVLLADFGIAITAHRTASWEPQKMAGSHIYMAPEQLSGNALLASDQYSLAVVVYEWICGVPPFTGVPAVVMHQKTTSDPPPFGEEREIPPAIESVVMKALAKNPKDRFPSVLSFANALEQACQPPPPFPPRPPVRRSPRTPPWRMG